MTGDASGGGSRISGPVRTCPLGSFEGPSSHCSWAPIGISVGREELGPDLLTRPVRQCWPTPSPRNSHRLTARSARVRCGSSLCENSDVELARRNFVSIRLNRKRTALAVAVERGKGRKQFCAFSARARFHTGWVKNGSGRARTACPLYPQEQPSSGHPGMAVSCHNRK